MQYLYHKKTTVICRKNKRLNISFANVTRFFFITVIFSAVAENFLHTIAEVQPSNDLIQTLDPIHSILPKCLDQILIPILNIRDFPTTKYLQNVYDKKHHQLATASSKSNETAYM